MKTWHFNLYKEPSGPYMVLSIFLAHPQIGFEELDSELARFLQGISPPDSVHFVGTELEISALRARLGRPGDIMLERLKQVLGDELTGLRFISFDTKAGTHLSSDYAGSLIGGDAHVSSERRYALLSIFRSSGGEERAPPGTHYAKTSEWHCDRFLRASNVLEIGENVRLVAFWLLPKFWRASARNVVVDTSGLYSVALTALQEVTRLGGSQGTPLVWSHRSHEGVGDISEEIAASAIFLVSASTSNGLVRKLQARGAASTSITTLFSLSQTQIDGHTVLCDLRAEGEVGLQPIKNLAANDCHYCREHFHLITIQGDQFSITPPRVTAVEIKGDDLSEKAKSALSNLGGLRSFLAYRRRDGEKLMALGADVLPLLNGSPPNKSSAFLVKLRARWEALVRRSLTVSLRNIVSTSYPGSSELAAAAHTVAAAKVAEASGLQLADSKALRDTSPAAQTSTTVISACTDESQELLSVSRTLRDVQPEGSTTYLSVMQLMAPKEDADRLKSNLTYGAFGPGTFSYFAALELSVNCFEEEVSWRAELTELQRFIGWADSADIDLPMEVDARVTRLEAAPATGMIDDLFWPDSTNQALRLRTDFALIDNSLVDPACTQADLYAVFCVVLTTLRNSHNAARRLAHNAYERGVLSPSNFDRFNDGVLQASILRAAKPKELAYGASGDHLSQQMLGILLDTLPSAQRPEKSEALIEFILALMMQRLTLTRADLDSFLEALIPATTDAWPLAALMGRYLRSKEFS